MSTLIYDTHKFITKMTNAGMPQPQAEVLAESHVELMETTLATKQDLKDLKAELTGEMKGLRGEIDKATLKTIGIITAIMVVLLTASNAVLIVFLRYLLAASQ